MAHDQAVGVANVAGRSWWKPVPSPPGPPISVARAYLEVLAIFGVFFGAGVANALLSLAGRMGGGQSAASWAAYGPATGQLLGQTGLAVVVVVLLSRQRGASLGALGLVTRRQSAGRRTVWPDLRVAAWALLSLLVSGAIISLLKTGSIPPGSATAADLLYRSGRSIEAGFTEECVVLAFVVVTLQQARRPTWEIVTVALALRVSYHLYYGPGAVGILVWASVFLWLFLRTRSLIPLIAVHVFWDLDATLATQSRALAGWAVLAMLTLLIAAPISWLAERSRRNQQVVHTGLTQPSWYPDPSGQYAWRWWDGSSWTAAVHDA